MAEACVDVTSLGPEKKNPEGLTACVQTHLATQNLFHSLLLTDWVSQEDSKYMRRSTVA